MNEIGSFHWYAFTFFKEKQNVGRTEKLNEVTVAKKDSRKKMMTTTQFECASLFFPPIVLFLLYALKLSRANRMFHINYT